MFPGHIYTIHIRLICVPGGIYVVYICVPDTHTIYICYMCPGGWQQANHQEAERERIGRFLFTVRCACFCLFASPPRVLLRNRGWWPPRRPARRPGGQQDGQLQFTTISAEANVIADGHTASNAPDLFRPPKLSGAGPGQYWGGGPPGKTLGCCQLLACTRMLQLSVVRFATLHSTPPSLLLSLPLCPPKIKSQPKL